MADRMVPVPASRVIDRDALILTVRDVSADHHGNGWLSLSGPEAARIADAVIAFLSQPEPSAEPRCDECGHDMADHTAAQGCTFGWHIAHGCMCGVVPPAEPPRIEDMAPGTTFTAVTHGEGFQRRRTFTRSDTFEGAYFESQSGGPYFPRDIDPSTIRDVTPPRSTTVRADEPKWPATPEET